MLHPVHTRLAPFQVLRRNGRAPLRQEHGWKDTVAIEDGEEVDVIIRWNGIAAATSCTATTSNTRITA